MDTRSKRTLLTRLGGIIAVGLLVLLVILLGLQNRELKSRIAALSQQRVPETLSPGDHVVSAEFRALEGGKELVQFDRPPSRHTLFVFSTTCPHCLKTLAHWKSLAERKGASNWRILGVSVDNQEATIKYIVENSLNFEVVCADTSFTNPNKIFGVPQTITIDEHGMVKNIYAGELTESQVEGIREEMDSSTRIR